MNTLVGKLVILVSKKWFMIGGLVLSLIFLAIAIYWSTAPGDFPPKTTISIEEGTTLSQTASILSSNNLVRSPFVYKVFVVMLGGSKNVIAGDYLFDTPQSALRIAFRTIRGIQGLKQFKITIPEGIAASDIGRLLAKHIPNFDGNKFTALARPQEGYLFPDTYYFYEGVTADDIIKRLRSNFDEQIRKATLSISRFGKSLDDIIKMASIIEKEAVTEKDRRIIAGILWKRLGDNHPLQVDAPFFYYLGKNSLDLTLDDLARDFPYNTYKNTGLTPTAIGNPGLEAIIDTVNPIKTDYYFYLSDKEGKMHYAETHDGHVANKQQFLQ